MGITRKLSFVGKLEALERIQTRGGGRYQVFEDPMWPLGVFGDLTNTRHVFFITKPALAQWILPLAKSRRCLFLCRYGLPMQATLRATRWFSDSLGLPISFVGDIDPISLTTFLVYRSRSSGLRSLRRRWLPMEWCGVDDEWLKLCERYLKKKYRLDSLFVQMSAVEKEHFKLLDPLLPELEMAIGQRSMKILRSSRVLGIEGACNPALYVDGFPVRLLERLIQRSSATPRPVTINER